MNRPLRFGSSCAPQQQFEACVFRTRTKSLLLCPDSWGNVFCLDCSALSKDNGQRWSRISPQIVSYDDSAGWRPYAIGPICTTSCVTRTPSSALTCKLTCKFRVDNQFTQLRIFRVCDASCGTLHSEGWGHLQDRRRPSCFIQTDKCSDKIHLLTDI